MALFQANDIYTPADHTEVILLKCFKVPVDEPIPTLTILFTADIRKIESRAAQKYNGFKKMRFLVDGDGKNQGEAELVDKPQAYCREVLDAAYQDSTGIFEKPTKELILAAIDEKPVFARALAGEIMGFFKSKDVELKAETEDARKNSDDS